MLPLQHKGGEQGITVVSIQVGKWGEESENFNGTSKVSARVGNRIGAEFSRINTLMMPKSSDFIFLLCILSQRETC